ncbi:DUF1014-domain-containing protein [Rozella allomycis CSF55]|uniref:DUF1014-domain-containing protein n=1 Tax=Rozella allomycis (strain CSF55) TaxID=988480 RepID=A0A075AWA0_ROZAC|nr:Protein of unknown function DUF1014 domain-containing protein [Rozella allomycis CSF55]RKP20619.1 DUF1014-domain-containing protein [Rozella allomycis CSF55]|eukprot:EPZ34437.1 Protein of unknown function DUF1014 domain-containing protein [Rozella allomycis CSF55]
MPKKFTGSNTKVEAAKSKKERVKEAKDAAEEARKAEIEAKSWDDPVTKKLHSKKDLEEAKRLEKLRRKEENKVLLQDEESSLPTRKTQKFTPPKLESFGAQSIDDAITLLSAVTQSTKVGADNIEKHPERRVKAAFALYEERELPKLKKEFPGLRLSQLKQILQKQWQKAPENPFNQVHVAVNATKEQKQDAAEQIKLSELDRLRLNNQ